VSRLTLSAPKRASWGEPLVEEWVADSAARR